MLVRTCCVVNDAAQMCATPLEILDMFSDMKFWVKQFNCFHFEAFVELKNGKNRHTLRVSLIN